MKTLKIIGVVIALLVVIIVGGGYYVFNNMGSIIKYAVETAGPELTKTEVTLDSAQIDIAEGSALLSGFKIGNPQGFDSDYVFNLGSMQLDIDIDSLQGNVIAIKTLNVESVDVQLEQKGSQINLWQLQKNLQAQSSGNSQSKESAGASEKSFMIEKLRFAEGQMKFISDKYGEKQLTLPTLSVENLGSRSEGLTAEELGLAILTPLLANAKKAAEKALEAELKGKIGDKIEEKLEKELGSELSEKLKDKENIDKAKEKLKQLF